MGDQNLLDAVKTYSENMTRPITFVLGSGEHDKRAELIDFLSKIAGTTDKINFDEQVIDDSLPSGISFKEVSHVDGETADTGIVFSGIPGGHEFTSLILAILQAGGHTLKLDEGIQKLIKRFNKPLQFQTYVSLSCHNCPEVVQALNQFALLNDGISNEMIDGALFQEQVEANKIQGVPAVFLNGKPFANGLIDTAKLIGKLQEQFPDLLSDVEDDAEQLEQQDVTIIGAGPAGVAAAIYTARKGLKVTMVADRIGGQVKDTQDIENLISVPLTNGTDLSTNFVKHLAEYNITLREHVSVKDIGEGVAFCAHCDGPFFKGKDISVIGGGNSGVEAALDLAGIVKHVTVLEFADELKADQVLINKARERDNIDIMTSVASQEVKATAGKVSS